MRKLSISRNFRYSIAMDIEKLRPKLSKADAQELTMQKGISLEQWKNFASRCQRNPALAVYVIAQHKNLCAACNRPSKGVFHIHHIDYAHACIHDGKKPDCTTCQHKSPEAFQACASRLVPVHGRCHLEIHKSDLDKKVAARPVRNSPKTGRSSNRDKMKAAVQELYNKHYSDELGQQGFLSYLFDNGYTLKRQTSYAITIYNKEGQRAQIHWSDLAEHKYDQS
jgi:hypothetical protein